MKKVGWLLVCVMLVLAVAVPVHANDTIPDVTQTNSEVPAVSEPQVSGRSLELNEGSEPAHEHSWGEGQITTAATCTAPGVRTYTCACLETKTEEIAATGHSFGSWESTQEKHLHRCTACGTVEEADHSFGSWQDNGANHAKVCSICSHKLTEDHKWGSNTILKKPTCKEEGILGHICSVCNAVMEEALTKLTIHTYDSACDSECNVCGLKRVVEHDFEEVWVKDSTGHWYACSKCDEKIAFSKHNPGAEATEETAQVCATCHYVIKPKKAHTHSFEKKWTSDDVGHWHACKTCDAEQEYAAHIFDDACDSDCNVCDFKKDTGHTYDETWETTKWEHWNICTVCGEESKHEKHITGPEATEEEAQLCTVCGYEIAPVQIHSHDFSDSWEWDTVNHWQLCSCGEASVAMEHTWDEGREIKDDVLEFRCIQCGTTRMERQESGFPWMILLVILALICIGGIVFLVILLKRGNFEDEEDTASDEIDPVQDTEEAHAEEDLDSFQEEPDAEEDMIDAFFASLDRES